MTRTTRSITIALALLSIPAIFLGIPALQIALAPVEEELERGTPIRVGNPEIRTLEQRVRYSGNLEADRSAAVIARAGGEVLDIPVARNDLVEAGDLIAVVEDDVAQLELAQARANLNAQGSALRAARRGARDEEVENARASVEQAEEELEVAESDLERTRRLFEAGTISRSELEAAENAFRRARTDVENARRSLSILEQGATAEELEQAESAVEAARRQYELAQLNLSYTDVRTPVSGRIVDLMAEQGATLQRGAAVAVIVNDDLVRARIRVPERRYSTFLRDDFDPHARVSAVALLPMDPAEAVVHRVGSTIDPQTRTFEVELIVDNPDGRLRPGMYVNAVFTIDRARNALSVPVEAVVRRANRTFVFVYERETGTVREVEVTRGIEEDGFVAVLGDIDEGSTIVVEGNSFLDDTQRVRVVDGQ